MSRSDGGSNVAVGLDPENLRERARFYADRNQIETAVFFAGEYFFVRNLFDATFTHNNRAPGCIFKCKSERGRDLMRQPPPAF